MVVKWKYCNGFLLVRVARQGVAGGRGNDKSMLAVIKTGGKQYKVSPGQKIKIEKLEIPENQEVIFDNVLLVEKDGKVEIGTPVAKNVKVIGKVLKQGKGDKIIVFKYKSKKRYKVKRGHRQLFTEVEIVEIK
ncbi:MAG: 50S ribosomal protein L21 [Parcubacteria group bacterium GW2011_GWF2_39_13b]|nr:MAG: 50S ribosomal protein L21 [Parcubacteria group bacterium GW2011_GWF2_39_13b]